MQHLSSHLICIHTLISKTTAVAHWLISNTTLLLSQLATCMCTCDCSIVVLIINLSNLYSIYHTALISMNLLCTIAQLLSSYSFNI